MENASALARAGAQWRPCVRYDTSLRPGLAFLSSISPDEVATNFLTIDAMDPKSGTAEFKATAIRVDKLPAFAARLS